MAGSSNRNHPDSGFSGRRIARVRSRMNCSGNLEDRPRLDDYFIVDVSEGVVRAAGILAENHALRGADAIHLASAVALGKQVGESVVVLCLMVASPLRRGKKA